jgi:hypothetical protein
MAVGRQRVHARHLQINKAQMSETYRMHALIAIAIEGYDVVKMFVMIIPEQQTNNKRIHSNVCTCTDTRYSDFTVTSLLMTV